MFYNMWNENILLTCLV